MATKNKKVKKLNLKKSSFKNPALVIVVVLLVAAGVFLAFQTFASGGTITASATGAKDKYGCPLNVDSRPTISYGSSGPCVRTAQNDLNKYFGNSNLVVDGQFGTKTRDTVILFQTQFSTYTIPTAVD